jgi:hypothetical protein
MSLHSYIIIVNGGGNRLLAEKSYNVICILELQDCKEYWLYAAFEYASIDQF